MFWLSFTTYLRLSCLVLHTYRCVITLSFRKRFRLSLTLPNPSSALLPPPLSPSSHHSTHPPPIHTSSIHPATITHPRNAPFPVCESDLIIPSPVCENVRASTPRKRKRHGPRNMPPFTKPSPRSRKRPPPFAKLCMQYHTCANDDMTNLSPFANMSLLLLLPLASLLLSLVLSLSLL